MFELGFFGTNAPLYMDIITLYFGLLPFLMALAIYQALKKRYELHYQMQSIIFIATLIIVGIFEVGVRVSGGFDAFMEQSNADYLSLLIFLILHILVAFASVILYSLLIYSAFKEFRLKSSAVVKSHKKLGVVVYALMSVTSFSGVLIYYFLFLF
jgi:putative membrane protein